MSAYTDYEHTWGNAQTVKWLAMPPDTPEAYQSYGDYQFRLKDYRLAVEAYSKAMVADLIPALFQLGQCHQLGLGTEKDIDKPDALFRQVIEAEKDSFEPDALYRIGMCHTYGWGTPVDEAKGYGCFITAATRHAGCAYEVGLCYKEGKAGMKSDQGQAERWLRIAYDGYYEDAIFALFDLYGARFESFPYQREIKEAYSFKVGRLLRVAELTPCSEYWIRLAEFYELGYPGDSPNQKKAFLDRAKQCREKALTKMNIYINDADTISEVV